MRGCDRVTGRLSGRWAEQLSACGRRRVGIDPSAAFASLNSLPRSGRADPHLRQKGRSAAGVGPEVRRGFGWQPPSISMRWRSALRERLGKPTAEVDGPTFVEHQATAGANIALTAQITDLRPHSAAGCVIRRGHLAGAGGHNLAGNEHSRAYGARNNTGQLGRVPPLQGLAGGRKANQIDRPRRGLAVDRDIEPQDARQPSRAEPSVRPSWSWPHSCKAPRPETSRLSRPC